MAYDKSKILAQAKELIAKHHLFFIADVVSFLPISKATFYLYFPENSDELDSIKELIDNERVSMKIKLRARLSMSKSDTGILALYKLICTDEERKALSMNFQEITGKDGKDLIPEKQQLTSEQIDKLIDKL